jgi:hypothetical protein
MDAVPLLKSNGFGQITSQTAAAGRAVKTVRFQPQYEGIVWQEGERDASVIWSPMHSVGTLEL